jgi:hypothetical protein
MVEKTERIKAVTSQKTLDSKKIRLSPKGEKIKCEHSKSKVVDIITHLRKLIGNTGKNLTSLKTT